MLSLKEISYGEFEKEGLGHDEKENAIRQKRASFWKKAGFEPLNIDVSLFGVVYSTCVLRMKNKKIANKKIVEYGFQIYEAVTGKKETQKNCFII